MPKRPTRPTQCPSPQWARARQRWKPRHSCRGGCPGWLLGVSDGFAHALWAVGAAAPPPGPTPCAQAAVDAADNRDDGRADRSRVDLERGPAVPRAAMAAASDGVSKQWWWEAARRGGLSRRWASTRLASRVSPGLRGPLGGQESTLN